MHGLDSFSSFSFLGKDKFRKHVWRYPTNEITTAALWTDLLMQRSAQVCSALPSVWHQMFSPFSWEREFSSTPHVPTHPETYVCVHTPLQSQPRSAHKGWGGGVQTAPKREVATCGENVWDTRPSASTEDLCAFLCITPLCAECIWTVKYALVNQSYCRCHMQAGCAELSQREDVKACLHTHWCSLVSATFLLSNNCSSLWVDNAASLSWGFHSWTAANQNEIHSYFHISWHRCGLIDLFVHFCSSP